MVNQSENPSQGFHILDEGDPDKYSINWKKEIVYILRAVMEKGELVSTHFDHGESFFLTAILEVDAAEEEVFLDFGANDALNRKILNSDKIIFVTAHDKVRVQFVANRVEKTRFEGRDAFKIELPESLIKLQRREYFRVATPIVNPLKCIIPAENHRKIEMVVVDISIGGIGVALPSIDEPIERGMVFHGCHLALPDIGNIVTSMEVRNLFEATLRNGQKSKRAGCQFIDLPANMQSMIQRYIIKVERERRAMQLDRE